MSTTQQPDAASARREARRRLLRIGIALGIGVAGTLDEVIFHQLLQWHNFYVQTTEFWRIFSDGLFHLFSSAMLGLGAALLWSDRRLLATLDDGQALVGGLLSGMGGFNLYDGTIQHKLLQLHPVREGVADQLPYDLAWNGAALALLTLG
ncbi:MAG TPA: DUF2243 domain-containing protein, partial [Roseiflexaceae bacterium]|nr:DUF2243 domain-containing protein [Roseiflexaceae bacterium]